VGVPLTQLTAATTTSRASSGLALRASTFGFLVVVYALLTIGVIVSPSPVLDADMYWLNLHLWGNHPQYHFFIYHYVMLGQRGPATIAFLPFFLWAAWRRRTTGPLVLLATALLLLNVSVGVVKYAVGRIGPRHSDEVHQIFVGGNIFPSGHVSNTVVLYGLLAWIAGPRFRRWVIAGAVFLCITIGIGTIYLRTHWFSDVVGGWLAGALVLLALPSVMPHAQQWADHVVDSIRFRRQRRGGWGRLGARRPADSDREPVGAGPGRSHGQATPVS
jgi:membrane-associated phospholipid phosphatase